MTLLQVKNRAVSTLASGISDSDLSLDVAAGEGAKFPQPGNGFHITIEDEILKCTARSTDTLTVTRAQEGTSAVAHSAEAKVELRITAKIISDLQDALVAIDPNLDGVIALDQLDAAVCSETEADGKISTHTTPNAHHTQAHTLASHSTKAHSELTGVTANQHHDPIENTDPCDVLRHSNDAERTKSLDSGDGWVKMKEIVLEGGLSNCRIKFDAYSTGTALIYDACIRKNGVEVGTVRTFKDSWQTFSEDLTTFAKGDLMQIYAQSGGASAHDVSIKNFRLYYYLSYALHTNQDPA